MLEEQGKGDSKITPPGNFADSSKLGEDDYRRIIAQLYNELSTKNARLKGVQALTTMLHETEEKLKWSAEASKNYEVALRRAEARIAQLNKLHGIGPQTAFNRGVVMPGVSKKDFDLVTQENLKLKRALDHIVPTNLGGHAVILKNQELFDLVSTMRDDLSRSENHIKDLEAALRGRDDGLAAVPELTKKVMKLERSLNAKQVFCETLMKENDRLKKANEELGTSERQEHREKNRDSTDGSNQKHIQEITALKEEMDKLVQENSMLNDRFEEMQRILSDCKGKIKSLEEEKLRLAKQASELVTIQRERQQENQRKTELAKENGELKKKCDGFFQQVVSLNKKQQESEEELDRMKRAFDHQKAELEEKKSMIHLMTESLKSYEDDFRRENEEKAKIQKMLDKAQQETDRTKRENQSHMATIRHLEDEFERMSKMLTEERKKGNDRPKGSFYGTGIFGNQPIPAAGARSMFMDTPRPAVTVGDGGRDESDGNQPKDPYSMPTTKSETSNAPSLIECPYCSRSYPYHLIEGHVQDCMEDSLYMDERD